MAMPVPPQFLPMIVTGFLVVRNMSKKKKRGPARMSTAATSARASTPGGMDGELYYYGPSPMRNAPRTRRGKRARCVPRR